MVLESELPGTMETCMRGFSFMPEKKVEVKLEYIEDEELERTWKTTRRQRLKEREQKIYEDFVKEQDVLSSVCRDDPYQFLEQLPEVCLKELLEIELQKMKKESAIEKLEQEKAEEEEQKGDGDSPRLAAEPSPPTVTFAELDPDDDVIHIFDDKDDDQSGPEDEALNDSLGSPCTVRDKFCEEKELSPRSPPHSPGKSSKSSENVTNMIESSIYCAKVKDLRMKINDEMMSMIESLERRDILGIDPEDMVKMCRRSTEFCARFNRIYMYQLHRQVHDVKRHNSASLPFARHTHFQSQMVRIVSLHQSLLQALQIFHKSFEQTGCVRESSGVLRCLAALAREASAACAAAPAPKHARDIYNDVMLTACDKLDEAVAEYADKISSYMNSTPNTSTSRSKKSKSSRGKKSVGTWSKSGSKIKSVGDSRLSMYSLDTLRINLHPKSSSSKDNQSSAGTSKVQGVTARAEAKQHQPTPRKSPKSRRPLMRDPQQGRARRPAPRDAEIRTMVEAVEACTSSHISREPSPARAPRRRARPAPRAPRPTHAPRAKLRAVSPAKIRRLSPQPTQIIKALSSIKSMNPLSTAESSQVQVHPGCRVHCAQRDAPRIERDIPRPSPIDSPRPSPRPLEDIERVERERTDKERIEKERIEQERSEREKLKFNNTASSGGRCEVTRIVRQLCGGDTAGNRNERVSGAKNAQLLCMTGGSSPRQPSTPQLLRILEETIQKKVPKGLFQKKPPVVDAERFRLTFNIQERTAENLFQYRTKFVQHMLASPMYANSSVGKPWEMISSVSDQIIDQLLMQCAEEMQLREIVQELYETET